jgi:hypothetical protein
VLLVAYIQKKGDSYYCQFYHLGRRHTVTVGAVGEAGPLSPPLIRLVATDPPPF